MRKYFLSLLFLLIFYFAVPGPTTAAQKIVYLNKVPPDTIIVLERGACETRCATYRLILFEDGTVIWNGTSYVRKYGLAYTKVDVTAIKTFIADAEAKGFFGFKSGYGVTREFVMSDSSDLSDERCTPTGHDSPVITLSISTGGQSKTVIHDGGCTGFTFDKLADLEHKIDRITNSIRWVR